MIIGHLNQLDKALLPKPLFDLLSQPEYSLASLLAKENGKHDIIGDTVFYIISTPTTAPESACKSEFHNEYIDIQVLLSGREVIAVSDAIVDASEYIEVKPDLIFVENDALKTRIVLDAGDFAIFYPGEVHRPTCQCDAPMEIKKAVFKISKTWLADQM